LIVYNSLITFVGSSQATLFGNLVSYWCLSFTQLNTQWCDVMYSLPYSEDRAHFRWLGKNIFC